MNSYTATSRILIFGKEELVFIVKTSFGIRIQTYSQSIWLSLTSLYLWKWQTKCYKTCQKGFARFLSIHWSHRLLTQPSLPYLPVLGVLFLQYGDETRRVHITHELSSLDTLHALIVHMFPQKLTAGMLKSPNTAILIKDEARNVFYELEDVRDIQDRSIIKIYRKEPIYASYPAAAHLANGDLRVRRREVKRANCVISEKVRCLIFDNLAVSYTTTTT